MDKEAMEYVNKRIIADAYLKEQDEDQKLIARDAVMNISGKNFVIYCAGREIFRQPHKHIEAYRMQSGNGMEFVYNPRFGKKKKVRVHFVQDVKTPKWHNEKR